MMRGKSAVALWATLALSGCTHIQAIMMSSDAPGYIGKPAAALLADKGAADGQSHSHGGATVYVYQAHDLAGTVVCRISFFARDGTVVGFWARGTGLGCGGSKGDTT